MKHIEANEINECVAVLGDVKRGSDGHPLAKRLNKLVTKPKRQRVKVNVHKINKYSKDGESLIVPGKVLSIGKMDHKVNIAAVNYSEKARKSLMESGSKIFPLKEMLKQKGIRIIV